MPKKEAKEAKPAKKTKETSPESLSEEASKPAVKEAKPETKSSSGKTKKHQPVQPEINIGLVGHVDHGKTTLTERLSGKWTDTHSEELKRGITIRLGYADITFYKCSSCKPPMCFTTKETCAHCGKETRALRTVSFVDAPGHESLMATMLAGATIMDGVLLLVAANESCPQPQTREHIIALEIRGIKNLIVVQNKIDTVKKEQAQKNYNEIKAFLKGTSYEDAPIVPLSAKHNINVDALIEAIEKYLPTQKRDETLEPLMYVARSFDINKPGSDPMKLTGGVLGGALVQGKLSAGDEIEIRPGRKIERENRISYVPLTTKIVGLKTGGAEVAMVRPGGSIGVMTLLDPSIVKSDTLTGSAVGHKGKLPPIFEEVMLETHLLQRVVGAKEELTVEPIKMGEPLMLNVNSAATIGVVTQLSKNVIKCKLKLAVCAALGSRVTISRRIANRFRLIGYGIIK